MGYLIRQSFVLQMEQLWKTLAHDAAVRWNTTVHDTRSVLRMWPGSDSLSPSVTRERKTESEEGDVTEL